MNDKLIEELSLRGYPVVAGVDEVGRGSWAGPLAVGAVILPPKSELRGVRDSKLLSRSQRERLSKEIRRSALFVGIGWASHTEIDEHGLTWAARTAALRALNKSGASAVVLDGKHDYLQDYCHVETLVKADDKVLSVACASIVAKVARDRFMQRMHQLYPGYGFDTNVGYGSAKHREAVKHSISPLHRRRFAPVMMAEMSQTAFMEMIYEYD